jgi:hypothetical protein
LSAIKCRNFNLHDSGTRPWIFLLAQQARN